MKNNSTFKFCIGLFIFFICFISAESITAQEKNIFEISKNTHTAKTVKSKKTTNDRQDFYKLAFNLATTVYIENNLEKSLYVKGPISKINMNDTSSFEFLKNNESNYKTAEIIIIKVNSINELNNSYDLTGLTEMTDLKYVYIKCSFKCQKHDIENFVKVNPYVRVFYNAEKPS
jgi:hypothetical protein